MIFISHAQMTGNEAQETQTCIKECLVQVLVECKSRVEIGLCLLDVSPTQLQDTEIVEGLCMMWVDGHSNLKCLVGKVNIPDANSHMAEVVPGRI